MSTPSALQDSPVNPEPLHNPARAAQVVVPLAPLGNTASGQIQSQKASTSMKDFLSRKLNKANSKFVSPTDSMMTPCSKKINDVKKNRFGKSVKPMQRLVQDAPCSNDKPSTNSALDSKQDVQVTKETSVPKEESIEDLRSDDSENPF